MVGAERSGSGQDEGGRGRRLMISDIVLLAELPELIPHSIDAYTGCLAGALLKVFKANKMEK